MEQYIRYTEKNKFNLSKFADFLPPELKTGYSDLVLKEIGSFGGERNDWEKEIELILRELEFLYIKDALEKLAENIKSSENNKKTKGLKEEEKKFTELTKKLTELEDANIKGIIP